MNKTIIYEVDPLSYYYIYDICDFLAVSHTLFESAFFPKRISEEDRGQNSNIYDLFSNSEKKKIQSEAVVKHGFVDVVDFLVPPLLFDQRRYFLFYSLFFCLV